MLKHRITVSKGALRCSQRKCLPRVQMHGVQAVKPVLQFDPVRTNVLHRASAHAAGDQGQILQPWPALLQGPNYSLVPILTRTYFDDPMFVGLAGQPLAHDLYFQGKRLDITCKHDVAAAAQDEGRVGSKVLWCTLRSRYGRAHITRRSDAHQFKRFGNNTKAVVFAQGDIFLYKHATIVASCLPLNCAFSAFLRDLAMPSFDTVCEPNMVDVKNAVENAAKEIATRFDFKGSSAAVELKDKEITLFGDADFQLQQVEDLLRAKLTKRNVDARYLDIEKIQKIGGDKVKQVAKVREGIEVEMAKKIVRVLKDSKMKVQASIQGDSVRVTGAKRDDLQAAMALLKKDIDDVPLTFNNFRD